AAGDQQGALAALAEALTLAAPEGYLRTFVDEGAPMATLLGTLLTTPATTQPVATHLPPAYLDRLLEGFEQAGQAVLPPSRRGAAPPRLVGVLIPLDPVKRHVTPILDKLGVANRVQAVTRARTLGLLR